MSARYLIRKLIHLTLLSLILLPILFGSRVAGYILLALSLLAITIELLRLKVKPAGTIFNKIFGELLKEREKHSLTGATYFVLAITFIYFFFSRQTFSFVIFVSVIVDGLTPIVSSLLREPPKEKDFAHFLTFITLAFIISAVSYHPIPIWHKIISGLTIGVIEFSDFYPDDNVWAPLAGAVVLRILTTFF